MKLSTLFSTVLAMLCLNATASRALAQSAESGVAANARPAIVYTLATGDKLRIAIFQEDDLTQVSRVDARGFVKLHLVDNVQVLGLTADEAQKTIENAYREARILRNPQVTVTVEEYAPREVIVQGEVKSPGRYTLPPESTMTLLDLITKAGGFTDTAKGNAVIVTRQAADGTRTTLGPYDAASMIKGKDRAKNKNETEASTLLLLPNDLVYVPQRVI